MRSATALRRLTQPRCSAPAMLPWSSGLPPRVITWLCNSRTAAPHSVARLENSVFSSGFLASSAALRKPSSPSRETSINSFSTETLLSAIVGLLSHRRRAVRSRRHFAWNIPHHAEHGADLISTIGESQRAGCREAAQAVVGLRLHPLHQSSR
ncbi:hypothetical protein D3C85_1401540 [compost metagenome]